MQGSWKKDYSRYRSFFLNILRIYSSRPDVKSFLEIILSLSTVLIFSLFAIKPTVLTIIELNKDISSKAETVSKLNQKIQNLQSASVLLDQQAAILPKILQAVPKNAYVENAVGQIQGIASQAGVNILGISSSDVTIRGEDAKKKTKQGDLPQNAAEVPITISVTGNYQNLSSLLANLENLRRPIKLDSFALNSSRSNDGLVLVMILTGRIPYLSQ